MRKFLIAIPIVLVVAAGAGYAWLSQYGLFASDPVFATDRGAIDGYDPVAFFVEGEAVRGDPDVTTQWRGAQWAFTSTANRDAFLADPERYAPAFGGYCAYAAGNEYVAYSDPRAFAIVDGRLYLNFDFTVKEQWDADRATLIEQGHAFWPHSGPGQSR